MRILLEVLGPPLIASLIFRVWRSLLHGGPLILSSDMPLVADFFVLLGFAYAFAGIQSLVFAAILETYFARGLRTRSWSTVVLSAALGFVSGAAIPLFFGSRGQVHDPWLSTEFIFVGLLTGVIMGAILAGFAERPGRKFVA